MHNEGVLLCNASVVVVFDSQKRLMYDTWPSTASPIDVDQESSQTLQLEAQGTRAHLNQLQRAVQEAAVCDTAMDKDNQALRVEQQGNEVSVC